MKKPIVTVIGSTNMDMVVKSEKIPEIGETVLGGDFIMVPGGKGANQAVAAAKSGAETYFITKLGKDIFGESLLENLKKHGVREEGIILDEEKPSGVAIIMINEKGENIITVAPGANSALSPSDMTKFKSLISSSQAILAQLEIPLETVSKAMKIAKSNRVKTILNPAPGQKLDHNFLKLIDILIPNQTELQILTLEEEKKDIDIQKISLKLLKYVGNLIVTLGEKGQILLSKTEFFRSNAIKVNTVDSTAAGDVFCGCLASAICEGKNIREAISFASGAAALSVTKMGAQTSIPSRSEIEEFIKSHSIKIPLSSI